MNAATLATTLLIGLTLSACVPSTIIPHGSGGDGAHVPVPIPPNPSPLPPKCAPCGGPKDGSAKTYFNWP
jgi:hypothetical protein